MTKQKNQNKIFDKFAFYYDQIYHDKNYKQEADFIVKNINKFGIKNSKNILDLGCGTGAHSVLFAKKGLSVIGLDKSIIALNIAKKKFKNEHLDGKFILKDFRDFKLSSKVDACISVFCSLCYLDNLDDFEKCLKSIKMNLKKNGILIFDIWNGTAVLKQGPSVKEKRIKNKSTEIIRLATPEINYMKQVCKIKYDCTILMNKKIIDKFSEIHSIRYHFIDDLKWILKNNGFEVMKISGISRKLEEKSYFSEWYLYVIAKKV